VWVDEFPNETDTVHGWVNEWFRFRQKTTTLLDLVRVFELARQKFQFGVTGVMSPLT